MACVGKYEAAQRLEGGLIQDPGGVGDCHSGERGEAEMHLQGLSPSLANWLPW